MALKINSAALARVCHEANRAWQLETGDPTPSPPWDEAPDWQRDSCVDGVRQALAGKMPGDLHRAWCDHKFAEGWTYGPVKDGEAKTHPWLIAYEDLPPEQRVKDQLFHSIVIALSGMVTSAPPSIGRAPLSPTDH